MMQSSAHPRFSVTRDLGAQYAYQPTNCPHQAAIERRADEHFMAMLTAYRGTGGLARREEVAAALEHRNVAHSHMLNLWIYHRTVICFNWQSQDWLPWFQFNSLTLEPHPQLKPLFDELTDVYEPLEMADWFAAPNPWLAGVAPVDTLLHDLEAVLDAARADHYIAIG